MCLLGLLQVIYILTFYPIGRMRIFFFFVLTSIIEVIHAHQAAARIDGGDGESTLRSALQSLAPISKRIQSSRVRPCERGRLSSAALISHWWLDSNFASLCVAISRCYLFR